ncbi:MAG: beta-lactamase family protein, partial [bacterium]
IDAIAKNHIKVGGVIGIIDKQQKRQVFTYGAKSIQGADAPDANTIFEIGSITKTFTTILLANIYLNGQFTDDTVAHYLPASRVTLPSQDGVQIRMVHLATHTSGIPRSPQRDPGYPLPGEYDPLNPYSVYTTDDVYDYLTQHCELEFTPGTWWSYSNTGMGLLGHIIGLVDGSSYQTVLQRDIFDELGMNNSSLFLTNQQRVNLALGHDENLEIVPNWYAGDMFQGAGFIKSSLNDMFLYLEANLGLIDTPLRDAMDLTHQPVMHQGSMGEQGLAWFILQLDDGQTIIYGGGNTNGYSAYIGFNSNASTGTIILMNSSRHDGANLIAGTEVLKAIMKY